MRAYQLGWIGLAGLSAVVLLTGCLAPETFPADANVGKGGGGTGGTGGTGGKPECSDDKDCDGKMVPPCNKSVCLSGECKPQPDDSLLPPDDGNVCTTDTCVGGVETYTNNNEPCGQNPSKTYCKDGACIGCEVDADCDPMTACQVWTCSPMGQCVATNGQTDLFNDPVGDCTQLSCDDSGMLKVMPDPSDVPPDDDLNDCMAWVCNGMVPEKEPHRAGTICGDGPSCSDGTSLKEQDTCDAMGSCVEGSTISCQNYACAGTSCKASCTDSADCAVGSAYCDVVEKTCLKKKSPGSECGSAVECITPYCPEDDKICCFAFCDDPCKSCFAGVAPGTCGNLSKGVVDKCSMMNQVCDESGSCVSLAGKAAVGGACVNSGDCFNHVAGGASECVNNLCRLHVGDVCDPAKPHECDTNLCDPVTHKCKECTANMDCPSMICDVMKKRCLFAMGVGTCGNGDDCQSGMCESGICK